TYRHFNLDDAHLANVDVDRTLILGETRGLCCDRVITGLHQREAVRTRRIGRGGARFACLGALQRQRDISQNRTAGVGNRTVNVARRERLSKGRRRHQAGCQQQRDKCTKSFHETSSPRTIISPKAPPRAFLDYANARVRMLAATRLPRKTQCKLLNQKYDGSWSKGSPSQ